MNKKSLTSFAVAAALCMPALADEKKSEYLPDSPRFTAMESVSPNLVAQCLSKAQYTTEVTAPVRNIYCAVDSRRPREKLVAEGRSNVAFVPLNEQAALPLECFVAVSAASIQDDMMLYIRAAKVESSQRIEEDGLLHIRDAGLVFWHTEGGLDISPKETTAINRIVKTVTDACYGPYGLEVLKRLEVPEMR